MMAIVTTAATAAVGAATAVADGGKRIGKGW